MREKEKKKQTRNLTNPTSNVRTKIEAKWRENKYDDTKKEKEEDKGEHGKEIKHKMNRKKG